MGRKKKLLGTQSIHIQSKRERDLGVRGQTKGVGRERERSNNEGAFAP